MVGGKTGNDVHCLKELQRFGIPISCFPIDSTGTMDLQGHKSWVQKIVKNSNIDHHHHHHGKNNSTTTNNTTTTPLIPVEVSTTTTAMHLKKGFDGVVSSNNNANNTASSSSSKITTSATTATATTATDQYYLETNDIRLSDICLGRGKRFQNHPGNIQFRQYLQTRQDEYTNTSSRQGKAIIGKEIANVLAESGCRFVRLVTTTTTAGAAANGGGGDSSTSVACEELWEEVKEKEIHKTIAQCFRTLRKKPSNLKNIN